MGIESDQLVFDYLSRVGDLAQQRGLPAATRMKLVSRLRTEIDGQKADSVTGVKKVLARLGTPEAVVEAAGGAPSPREQPPADDPAPRRFAARDKLTGAARDKLAGTARDKFTGTARDKFTGAARDKFTGAARDKLAGLAWRSGLRDRSATNGTDSAENGKVPTPREGDAPSYPTAGLPPHLAGADELGDAEDAPDWWRVEPAPFGPGETVPGFVGGIEIPEIWDRPKRAGDKDGRPSLTKDGEDANADANADASANADADAEEGASGGKRPLPGLLRRAIARRRGTAAQQPTDDADAEAQDEDEAAGPVPLRAWLSPVPTLAVLLLVAGAVLGSWLALAGGWALAYVSRRLTRAEAKFAALGVPGTVAGGLTVWLWGRFDGRWGQPIAQGHLGQELLDALPTMARVAAVASAVFLLWRMRRTVR